MMMKNKMIRALGLSAAAVGLTIGSANAGLETGNAQVVVLSTITAAETVALNFGTIAAFADDDTPTNTATLTVPADGTAPAVTFTGGSAADANIVVITAGVPGEFQVTGAAPNAALTLTLATPTPTLTDPSGTSTNAFTFGAVGLYMTLNGSGNTFTSDTDATGALTFQVGGTITTVDTGMTSAAVLTPYDDATYTGTYTVDISY